MSLKLSCWSQLLSVHMIFEWFFSFTLTPSHKENYSKALLFCRNGAFVGYAMLTCLLVSITGNFELMYQLGHHNPITQLWTGILGQQYSLNFLKQWNKRPKMLLILIEAVIRNHCCMLVLSWHYIFQWYQGVHKSKSDSIDLELSEMGFGDYLQSVGWH